jgi:photosystem I P700 chlorophyll a apoprotein A1
LVYSDFSLYWSRIGSFNPSLSKGSLTTTFIFNLHAESHDFNVQDSVSPADSLVSHSPVIRQSSRSGYFRKVLSTSIAHFSVLALWMSGMSFHGSYISNYSSWLSDPQHVLPSAQIVSSIVGQDVLNADVGGAFRGLYITSGLFSLWRSHGVISIYQLKISTACGLSLSLISLLGSYYHMHISWTSRYTTFGSLTLSTSGIIGIYSRKFIANIILASSLSSILWSGHLFHVSIPSQLLLSSHLFDQSFYTSSSIYQASLENYTTTNNYYSVTTDGSIN